MNQNEVLLMVYRPYIDLETRTYDFAKNVRLFVKAMRISIHNREDISQLLRSSGSVGSNYIEANEAR